MELRTKGVPDNQSKLRNLLSLLAELHERRLSSIRIKQLSDPYENFPILFADSVQSCQSSGLRSHPCSAGGGRLTWISCRRSRRTSAGATNGHAVVVLLLRCSGGSSGSLGLSMLLSRQGGVVLVMLSLVLSLVVLGLMMMLLLLKPGRLGLRVLVLVREDVLSLSLEHGDG